MAKQPTRVVLNEFELRARAELGELVRWAIAGALIAFIVWCLLGTLEPPPLGQ